jgi:hypothetical protein
MGCTYSIHGSNEKSLWFLYGKDHAEYIDGRIIWKWFFKKRECGIGNVCRVLGSLDR